MPNDVIAGKRRREQMAKDGKMVKRKRSEQREKSRKTDKPGQHNNRTKVCKREEKKKI